MFGIDIFDAGLIPAMSVALIAGIVSFLSPCVLPIVPPYLAYMSGVSINEMNDEATGRRKAITAALFFVMGLSTVFILLGFAASAFGAFFLQNQMFFGQIAGVTIIVFGLIYVYFPFMLFPLAQGIAMIPEDARQAAEDLGASPFRILWEIDLPLASPGIVVGSLLSFVLAAGALAESKLLGGQAIIVFTDEVETAFTYGQNWPLGSALAMILILIIGILAFFTISKIDLDSMMGRRR